MVRRPTAIVLIIFIILVAVAWYLQREDDAEVIDETVTSTPAITLFDMTAEDVSRVQIERAGGDRLIMERDAQGIWSFVEPAGREIDQAEAQSIAENILNMTVLTGLDQSPALDVIGLDKPGHRILLTSMNGEEQSIIVGILTPTSSGYYVSRMGEIPVIVSKSTMDMILDSIDNPPIFVTPTPSVTPVVLETSIPEATQQP